MQHRSVAHIFEDAIEDEKPGGNAKTYERFESFLLKYLNGVKKKAVKDMFEEMKTGGELRELKKFLRLGEAGEKHTKTKLREVLETRGSRVLFYQEKKGQTQYIQKNEAIEVESDI